MWCVSCGGEKGSAGNQPNLGASASVQNQIEGRLRLADRQLGAEAREHIGPRLAHGLCGPVKFDVGAESAFAAQPGGAETARAGAMSGFRDSRCATLVFSGPFKGRARLIMGVLVDLV
jgi:hypothetical protein